MSTKKSPDEIAHGSASTYNNHGCRCAECRRAASARRKAQVDARRGQPIPEHVQHGRLTTYGYWSCRCRPCTDAWTTASVARRRRRLASPAT